MSIQQPFRLVTVTLAGPVVLAGLLLAPSVHAQPMAQASDIELARAVTSALKAGDAAALLELTDLPARHAERFARGLDTRPWDELDARAQELQAKREARAWIDDNAALHRRATLLDVGLLEDPDAGLGPVPQRHLVRATVRDGVNGHLCDVVLVTTKDGRLLDLLQNEPYDPADASPGDPLADLAPLSAPVPDALTWPDDVDAFERRGMNELIDEVLALPEGRDRNLALESLHRSPHAAAAALIERLRDMDDAAAHERLVAALTRITGRPGSPGEPVEAWLRWHQYSGRDFVPAAMPEILDPTIAEHGGIGTSEPPALERWDEALAKRGASNGDGDGDEASGPSDAAGTGSGDADAPPGTPASPEPAPSAGGSVAPPKPPAPSERARDDDASSSRTGSSSKASRDLLFPAAADLGLLYGRKKVTGRDVEDELPVPVRHALNRWADAAGRLELTVIVSPASQHVVLGGAPEKQLLEVSGWMEDAWELLDPALPVREGKLPGATVAFVFDQSFARSDAWGELMAELVAQKALGRDAADHYASDPGGVTLRQVPMFLQPNWDMAGNAAAGDDEFRLSNEVAHKHAQCMVTTRLGQQPASILWGMGYVVEQKLFGSTYQFNAAGFVATGDHFDWPVRTRQMLEKRKKGDTLSLARMLTDEASAGKPEAPQLLSWAVLDYLVHQDAPRAQAMLTELAALHAEGDPYGIQPVYRGDPARTRATIDQQLGELEPSDLVAWLKKKK